MMIKFFNFAKLQQFWLWIRMGTNNLYMSTRRICGIK